MSEKVKIKISPAVAQYLMPGVSCELRQAGCDAASEMSFFDRVTLLFCLSKDREQSVRAVSTTLLENLPMDVVDEYATSPDAHPAVLELLAHLRGAGSPGPVTEIMKQPEEAAGDEGAEPDDMSDGAESRAETEEEVNEDSEEFLSKFKMAQIMGIAEKIKMALTGDKEWRSILVKDANKLVSGSVIKNPRITEAEIHTLIKSGIQNDEIIRLICANKEWIKSYKIRKALIENNRTPVQNSMRYLSTMGEKDLAQFAKSKNISSVVSTMAKRLLLNKKK